MYYPIQNRLCVLASIFCMMAIFILMPKVVFTQPIYEGDASFYSQFDLDNWNPAYTEITGNVYIGGYDIVDLSNLQNLTTVGASLNILFNQNLSAHQLHLPR